MMRQSIHACVCTNISNSISEYTEFSEKIRGFVFNKVSMMTGPAPMHVGHVVDDGGRNKDDADAVSMNTQCFKCWGWGRPIEKNRSLFEVAPELGQRNHPATRPAGGTTATRVYVHLNPIQAEFNCVSCGTPKMTPLYLYRH